MDFGIVFILFMVFVILGTVVDELPPEEKEQKDDSQEEVHSRNDK